MELAMLSNVANNFNSIYREILTLKEDTFKRNHRVQCTQIERSRTILTCVCFSLFLGALSFIFSCQAFMKMFTFDASIGWYVGDSSHFFSGAKAIFNTCSSVNMFRSEQKVTKNVKSILVVTLFGIYTFFCLYTGLYTPNALRTLKSPLRSCQCSAQHFVCCCHW